jgi:porin
MMKKNILPIIMLSALYLFLSMPSSAQINPTIQNSLYNPGNWDTAGNLTDTFWLHPPKYIPGQDWGVFSGNWKTTPSITGSWGGLRDKLERKGVQIIPAYFGQFAANPLGGEKKGDSWKGDIGVSLFVDLERLTGWKGGYMLISGTYVNPGRNLSGDYIGNFFPVQMDSLDENGGARLVHFALAQQLFNNTTELVLGRIITGEDFAFTRLACTSVSPSICANPIAGRQTVTFPTYPIATWGARLKYKPNRTWYTQVGTYLVYEGLGNSNTGGLSFRVPNGSGMLTLGEVGYYLNNTRDVPGFPGVIKAGGYYTTERLTELDTGKNADGSWGIYLIGENKLYSEKSRPSEGLSGFLALSYSPEDRNEITFMASGGLSYQGVIPDRSFDTLAFNFAYGLFSDDLNEFNRENGDPTQDAETYLELNYRIQVAPWLFLQPTTQVIIKPDGRSDIDDAFVLGFAVGTVL